MSRPDTVRRFGRRGHFRRQLRIVPPRRKPRPDRGYWGPGHGPKYSVRTGSACWCSDHWRSDYRGRHPCKIRTSAPNRNPSKFRNGGRYNFQRRVPRCSNGALGARVHRVSRSDPRYRRRHLEPRPDKSRPRANDAHFARDYMPTTRSRDQLCFDERVQRSDRRESRVSKCQARAASQLQRRRFTHLSKFSRPIPNTDLPPRRPAAFREFTVAKPQDDSRIATTTKGATSANGAE